ncbi:MAG: membrane dipeptidase [Ruminococcaceae bacterium]|nr:membrane dipeptidase [Oscillospiraceae bacterium]
MGGLMVVVDSHCDTATTIAEGQSLFDSKGHWSLKRARKYSGFVQFFAAFVPPEETNPEQYCLTLLDGMEQEIENNRDCICKATCYETMQQGLQDNKVVAFLTVEGGFGSDPAMVQTLYEKGVRCMSLSWNEDTPLCGGVLGTGKGVSELGRKVVREMNRLGMVIDVSHASDQSFYDLAKMTEKPLLATHSNSRSICDHPRNLTDEQFQMICEMDGMVGLNCYPLFLNQTKEADVTDLLRHIEHFLTLGGEKCIGFGADFDGIDFCMKDFNGIQDYEFLYESLCRFYSENIVNAIFCENYLRFLKNYF